MKTNDDKLVCIKNKQTGKFQRVTKSTAESIIAENPDWHYTTKKAYQKFIKDQEEKYTTIPNNTVKYKKPKGYFGLKNVGQRIPIVTPIPEDKQTVIRVFTQNKKVKVPVNDKCVTPTFKKIPGEDTYRTVKFTETKKIEFRTISHNAFNRKYGKAKNVEENSDQNTTE